MKKKVVLCSAALLAANCYNANAVDFGDKFYGKAQIGVGYDNRFYSGEAKKLAKEADTEEFTTTNLVGGAVSLNVGYNLYFKLNESVHPFIGVEGYGRLPVFGKNMLMYNDYDDYFNIGVNEYFGINSKFGAKINLVKNFALEPYALVGMNVVDTSIKYDMADEDDPMNKGKDSKKNVGLNIGAGVNTVICDRFTAGIEYRYGLVKSKKMIISDDENVPGMTFKTHVVAFKFGVQF